MKLKTIVISFSFLLLSKTYSKNHQKKYIYHTFSKKFETKKFNSPDSTIYHKEEHEEDLHIEEDLAILNTEPIIFIVVLKQALSQQNPNVSAIRELIQNNLQFINFVDPQENTALSLAIEANNDNIVEFLLEKGAQVIEKNRSLIIKSLITIKWSQKTSYQAGLRIIELLLQAGANPNFKENCEISHSLFIWTPLRMIINIVPKVIDNVIPHLITLLIHYDANIHQRFQPTNTTILTEAINLSKYFTKTKVHEHQAIKDLRIKAIIKMLLKMGATQ